MGNSRASRETYNAKRKQRRAEERSNGDTKRPLFVVEAPPSSELTAEEILAHKRLVFGHQKLYEEGRKLIHVAVDIDGPFGIWNFGDLHLDDDGMDVVTLEKDLNIVLNTPAMLAGHVGDVTNNWVGKLAHLHGKQTTTANQAWTLAKWFFSKTQGRMVYLCLGNHDVWSQDRDILQWIAEQTDVTMEPLDMRLNLDCPNGKSVTMNIKHTHKGNSMWNVAHGQMRFAQKGIRDDIIISGHRHVSGYGIVVDPLDGKLCHCIQVASYKIYDDFGRTHDLPPHFISPSVVTIINPMAATKAGLVTVFHDTQMGADFLNFLRKKEGFR